MAVSPNRKIRWSVRHTGSVPQGDLMSTSKTSRWRWWPTPTSHRSSTRRHHFNWGVISTRLRSMSPHLMALRNKQEHFWWKISVKNLWKNSTITKKSPRSTFRPGAPPTRACSVAFPNLTTFRILSRRVSISVRIWMARLRRALKTVRLLRTWIWSQVNRLRVQNSYWNRKWSCRLTSSLFRVFC